MAEQSVLLITREWLHELKPLQLQPSTFSVVHQVMNQ